MIITFYDKDFIALQENASLNVGKWSLVRRAVDFDDFTATSEPFLEEINPTFVVLKDDYGRYKYASFAGIPELDNNNQTKLQASDLKTIFNNDILVNLGSTSNVKNYFDTIISEFNSQVVQNSFIVELDTSEVSGISFDNLIPSNELKLYSVWEECFVPYLKYYNLYIDSYLDIRNKKIVFHIKRIDNNVIPLRLWEYGIRNFGKYIVSVNECQGAVLLNGTTITYGYRWLLKADNSITTNTSLRDLYPIKRKIVVKETDDSTEVQSLLSQANVEALKTLVEARYQENFNINASGDVRLENVDFDTMFNVYSKRSVLYKTLPLGEISEDNTGTKKLKIGYKPDDIVYYL